MPSRMRVPEDLAARLMLVCAGVFVIATATILAAHAFERIGGYAPCPLCLEERYAYYFAMPASFIAFFAARGNAIGAARPASPRSARLSNQCGARHLSRRHRVEVMAGPDHVLWRFRPEMGRGRRDRYADHPLRRGVLALPCSVLRGMERRDCGASRCSRWQGRSARTLIR